METQIIANPPWGSIEMEPQIAILQARIMNLALALAALGTALAGTTDPAIAGVLQRWEERMDKLEMPLPICGN